MTPVVWRAALVSNGQDEDLRRGRAINKVVGEPKQANAAHCCTDGSSKVESKLRTMRCVNHCRGGNLGGGQWMETNRF